MDEAASFIAKHVLGVFLGLSLVALGMATLLWHLVRRLRTPLWRHSTRLWYHVAHSEPALVATQRFPLLRKLRNLAGLSESYLLLDLVAGFVLVLGTLSVFFEIADEVGLDEELGQFDQRLASELASSLSDSILRAFALVTRLGDASTQYILGIAVALILLWRHQRWLALIWIAAVGGNGLLNRALKAVFHRERPLHDHGWVIETGWSFPSGHASGAVAIYGMLAYILIRSTRSVWHLPVSLAAISIILLVGFSRVALQVHYFSDVIAGFASASAWLMVCIAVAEVMRGRQQV